MMFQKKFMGRAVAAIGLFAVGAVCIWSYVQQDKDGSELETAHLFVMDTDCSIALLHGDPAAITQRLRTLGAELDCYAPESDLYALNHGATLAAESDAGRYLLAAAALQEEHPGAVDITAGALTMLWGITTEHPRVPEPSELAQAVRTIGLEHLRQDPQANTLTLDPGTAVDGGASAKGFALDETARLLDAQGVTCGTISMTSSMLLYGEKPDGSLFSVAVRDPDGGGILGTIQTGACFLSTSGGYERSFTAEDGTTYCHILDPETGQPIRTDLASVTVLCDSGILSDYLSTLIYMGGTAALEPHLEQDAYQVFAVDCTGRLYASDGIQFTPVQDLELRMEEEQ